MREITLAQKVYAVFTQSNEGSSYSLYAICDDEESAYNLKERLESCYTRVYYSGMNLLNIRPEFRNGKYV